MLPDELFERLQDGDPESWELLLEFVRKVVRFRIRNRPIPLGLDFDEFVEEYVGAACLVIVENLNRYSGRGSFEGFVRKTVVRSAYDQTFKLLLQAVKRFFDALPRFEVTHQKYVRQAVTNCTALTEEDRRLLWHRDDLDSIQRAELNRIYLTLCHCPTFEHALRYLSARKVTQAQTVLSALHRLNDGLPASIDEAGLQDETSLLDEILNKKQQSDQIWECLGKLRKKAPIQWEVIVGRYFEGRTYEELAIALNRTVTALRKSHQRGIENLRACLENIPT